MINDFIDKFEAGGVDSLVATLNNVESFDDSSISFSYGATIFDYVAEQVCEALPLLDLDETAENISGLLMTLLPHPYDNKEIVEPVVAALIVFGTSIFCGGSN